MRRTRWIGWERTALLTLTIVLGQARRLDAGAEPAEAIVVVRIENRANVGRDVLTAAWDHVERIYADAGIQTIRVDRTEASTATSATFGRNGVQLLLVLASEKIAPLDHISGIALGHSGQGSRRAYVFPARLHPHAERARKQIPFLNPTTAEALVLGHAIAHEMGHLMLPPGDHPSTGIMRAQIHVADAFHRRLVFRPEEEVQLQAVLSAVSSRKRIVEP